MDIKQQIKLSYDEIGYRSFAFSHCSPLKLEAIAVMLGLNSPSTKTARVLEIGCSYGGNLIPFALNHPNAAILGVDLSDEQIRGAQKIVSQIGLKNIEFKQMDICEFSAKDAEKYGKFDYIIAHGVFSWVPPSVQSAIISLIKNFLSPFGVAYISYNTYPGWKIQDIIRDLMLLGAKNGGGTREKLANAKHSLIVFKEFFLSHEAPLIPSEILINKIDDILSKPDEYLIHEYLEGINDPWYFSKFALTLESSGLSYLCESTLDDIFRSELGDEKTDIYMNENFADRYDKEQFMDLYVNKTFRRSLIVHKEAYDKIKDRDINPSDIAKLEVVGKFWRQDGVLMDERGCKIEDRFSYLCEILGEIYPQSANIAQIMQAFKPEKRAEIYLNFLNLLGADHLRFSLDARENLDYEVGKTRIKRVGADYFNYFLKNADEIIQIGFADVFNNELNISIGDCFMASKFDGKNTIDAIAAQFVEFLKANSPNGVQINGEKISGAKLSEFALKQARQTEYLLKECYFFEKI